MPLLRVPVGLACSCSSHKASAPCLSQSCVPIPTAFTPLRKPRRRRAPAAMFGIVSVALLAGCSSGSSDAGGALDWDSLPSSFATECSVWTNPDPDSFATNTPPPAEVQVRAATVEHTTGDRVKISLSFLAPPPPPPPPLQVPGVGSQTIAQPGSVDFSFAVYPSGMNGPNDYSLFFQRDTQNVWTVSGSRTLTPPERAKSGFDLESVVGTVDSSRVIGNDLIAEVDLAQFPAVLREPVFAPDVQVSSKQAIPRDPYRLPIEGPPNGGPPKTGPSNMGLFMFATQNCSATDSDIAMDGGAFTSTFETEPRSAAVDPETFANPTKAGSYQSRPATETSPAESTCPGSQKARDVTAQSPPRTPRAPSAARPPALTAPRTRSSSPPLPKASSKLNGSGTPTAVPQLS